MVADLKVWQTLSEDISPKDVGLEIRKERRDVATQTDEPRTSCVSVQAGGGKDETELDAESKDEAVTCVPSQPQTQPPPPPPPLPLGAKKPVLPIFASLPRPSRKMKIFNWSKLTKAPGDSLWSKIECTVKVNYSQIDELFCQAAPRPKSAPSFFHQGPVSHVHILDSRKSLSINIILKQHKEGYRAILRAIHEGRGLSAPSLKGLSKLLPQSDELALIKSHPCNRESLGEAEKFFLELSDIPNYALRIQIMRFREDFPGIVEDLQPRLQGIIETSRRIMEDAFLRRFFALVLQVGNYLNFGSYAGGAEGFKLSSLRNLLHTRANKPKFTLLHFIVEIGQSEEKNFFSFTSLSHDLRSFARLSVSSIEMEVNSLRIETKNLLERLQQASEEVQAKFEGFLVESSNCVESLAELLDEVKDSSEKLAKHFCEDVTAFKIEECFITLADFFDEINRSIAEILRWKMDEERSAKSMTERVRRKKGGHMPPTEECLINLLLKEIRSGTVKLRPVSVCGSPSL